MPKPESNINPSQIEAVPNLETLLRKYDKIKKRVQELDQEIAVLQQISKHDAATTSTYTPYAEQQVGAKTVININPEIIETMQFAGDNKHYDVLCIEYINDATVAFGHSNGTVSVHNLNIPGVTSAEIMAPKVPEPDVKEYKCMHCNVRSIKKIGNNLLACAGDSSDIAIIDLNASDNKIKHVLSGRSGNIIDLAFRESTGELISCSNNGTVKLWDARGSIRDCVPNTIDISGYIGQGVLCAQHLFDKILAIGTIDKGIILLNLLSRKVYANLETNSCVNAIQSLPNDRLACGLENGVVQFWDWYNKKVIQQAPCSTPANAVCALQLIDNQLLSCSMYSMDVWDENCKRISRITEVQPPQRNWCALLLPDGKLVNSRNSAEVKVFDCHELLQTHGKLRPFTLKPR